MLLQCSSYLAPQIRPRKISLRLYLQQSSCVCACTSATVNSLGQTFPLPRLHQIRPFNFRLRISESALKRDGQRHEQQHQLKVPLSEIGTDGLDEDEHQMRPSHTLEEPYVNHVFSLIVYRGSFCGIGISSSPRCNNVMIRYRVAS